MLSTEQQQIWQRYCQTEGIPANQIYDAFAFGGESPAQIDALAELVCQGIKRGTASALALYEKDEALPKPGEYSLVLNHTGQIVALIQTTAVEFCQFRHIDDQLAQIEGEGDKSLASWRKNHEEFFQPLFREVLGRPFTENDWILFEHFKLITTDLENNKKTGQHS
ncbi:uncharacterized protein YhfF [Weissella uvarum]|uniref:ASCH domain-containing protein n=1 Tax=Weissella uvarum TaxID=1479233 RepID=UPI00196184A4|nr:ASCH domain-containing protein [Weissella uvarum]MBM7617502.1 uncharacterized protein YhfF [Weissella uvarum]MCM0595614.1 ASCH domain-containing protein [Weissella uvarum]